MRPSEGIIVLFSNSLAGTELRFFRIWKELRKSIRIQIALTEALLNHLKNRGEWDGLDRDGLVILRDTRLRTKIIWPILYSLRSRNLKFMHFCFPSYGVICRFFGVPTSFSYTHHSLLKDDHSGFFNKVLFWISAIIANQIDILNPEVFKPLSTTIFKTKLRLTRGSFTTPSAEAGHKRENLIVWMGRIGTSSTKGWRRLIKSIPEIDRALQVSGITARLELLAAGKAVEEAKDLLSKTPTEALKVKLSHAERPERILREGKVFLSLQENSNYPSQALLEAMSAGCLPIITDVGESWRMAESSFAKFIPGDFTEQELASAIVQKLSLGEDFEPQSMAARNFVATHFSMERHLEYYRDFFSELGEN